jgi:hypothetical protein
MKLSHHGMDIEELLDEWWAEAGMVNFVPTSRSYCVEQSFHEEIQEVSIEDVGPVLRKPIFRDGSEGEGTKRERVIRLLRDFRLGRRTHPVEVVEGKPEYRHRYKLTHGAHRLYCSLAAGFTHVPVVINEFDINAPDN